MRHCCSVGYVPRVSRICTHVSGETDKQTSNQASNISVSYLFVDVGGLFCSLTPQLLKLNGVFGGVCYVNLCPHHKYTVYNYVSQQEYTHRLSFLLKKINLPTNFVDKSENYLYNEVKTLREITHYPPATPTRRFHTPSGYPVGVFFCLNSAGVTCRGTPTRRLHPHRGIPTRRFHSHIGNLQNTKLLSGLHSICRGGGVPLAPPASHIFIFPHR